MTELDAKFTADWMKRVKQIHGLENYNATRLLKNIQERGGVSVARRMLERNGCSENFELLKRHNQVELSMEALIVKGEFGALFEDDEVNQCFALLCECGYFG